MSNQFLLDPIWPVREVHILTGESGVGKTTLLTQWINDLLDGKEILGMQPPGPQQVVYVSNERSKESLELSNKLSWGLRAPFLTIANVMERIGLPEEKRWSYAALKAMIELLSKDYRVIAIDPIVTFCQKPNDQNEVHKFLYNLAQNVLKTYDVTILATGHPPKEHRGQEVKNIRQKVAGSHGWGSFSNCNMHLEWEEDENRMNSSVRLEVRSRHASPMEFFFDRDEVGRFIPQKAKKEIALAAVMLDLMDRKQVVGEKVVTTKEAVNQGEAGGFSTRSVMRWLAEQEKAGILEHKDRGEWEIKKQFEVVGE